MARKKGGKRKQPSSVRTPNLPAQPTIHISKALRNRLKRLKKRVHKTLLRTKAIGEILAQPLDLGD